MANLGGGAQAHARFKQYDYNANASLVLNKDSCCRDLHEPTGEPESLYGKIGPGTFGDRVIVESKRPRVEVESVLMSSDEGVYRPKTKETRLAYEVMLGVIQRQLGGQPLGVVTGAADEILDVLKNDGFKDGDKKKEIEKLLHSIPTDVFDRLVSIGRFITDYQYGGGDVAGDGGAADGDDALVGDDEEEDDDDLADGHGSGDMQMGAGIDYNHGVEANDGMNLNVQDIDAYWLQRKISQAYEQHIDPQQSQKLAEEVLKDPRRR
ncbi:hypothetical protein POM88_009753 [Heracleum sosnowskyi]|uniref:Uncharacterized protein n=1 Tax=Heracleum sosnowskyi TaxID=360622 RepID=A0AAD8J8J2_9APIA|nr:hypothetical protein POM88_009753 [Heracleum sosnowskyi]